MAYSYIPKIVYNATTITFDYPPEDDPKGESFKATGTVTTSKSGIQQTTIDYIEKRHGIKFAFISETLKAQIETFLVTHALLGKEFSYFFDKDDPLTEIVVQLERTSMNVPFEIITRKGAGFIYRFDLKMRRVIA